MTTSITEHTIHIAVVAPQERVDVFSAPALREQCQKLLDRGVAYLVVDLKAVPFLDSAALAVLVSMLKQSRRQGGDVKLVRPDNTEALRIFRLTQLDRVFQLVETRRQALAAFGA